MPAPKWIHDFLDMLPPEKAMELVQAMKTGKLPPDLKKAIEKAKKEAKGG